MQNLVNNAPVKRNYDFIDHIRCLAMMCIVAEHCLGTSEYVPGTNKYLIYILLEQVVKFGTILFFLLAGFLIGDKFTDYTPAQYLKRRLASTFWPWLFWSLVYCALAIWGLHITEGMYHDGRWNVANILDQVKTVYLYTNYWFIINFLASITLLLIFKKHLYSYVFGGVLLAFTLLYGINIHYEWFYPKHTTAILGFIFFLWLGAQLRKYWQQVEAALQKTAYIWLILATAFTFWLSYYEMTVLTANHSVDPLNTLRISNVLYSLVVFALMLKIKRFNFTRYVSPRQTTYGIYLIHYIIVVFVLRELLGHLEIDDRQLSTGVFFAYKMFQFVVVYLMSVSVVLLFNKTPLKVLFGN